MSRWCCRRALGPLCILLRAYPGPLWHLYHRMELLDILEELAGSCQLMDDERETVVQLIESLTRVGSGAVDKITENPQTTSIAV